MSENNVLAIKKLFNRIGYTDTSIALNMAETLILMLEQYKEDKDIAAIINDLESARSGLIRKWMKR